MTWLGQQEFLALFQDLFQRSPKNVNWIITHIVLNEDVVTPEWIRGRPTLADLPRFGGHCPYHMDAKAADAYELGLDIIFIVENGKKAWFLDVEGFHFEDENEMLLFKLGRG